MNEREGSVLPAGTELAGKYRIEGKLGSGSMGVVMEATHLGLRQRVAIKFLRPEARAVPGAAERFLREARAASMLRSEHVARVFDMGMTEGGLVYMVMEYLEGEDLQQRLGRRGPFTTSEAVGYVLQACEGLSEAHRAGLVHRDIKPSNLFRLRALDGAALIKLLDFGLTKTDSAQDGLITTKAVLLGSPVYMAPEQLASAHDVDPRADIWSLGVVLYELLTASAPFSGALPALSSAIANQAAVPPSHLRPDLPPALDAVILRCLRKEPEERWANVAAFATALSAWAPPGQRDTAERCVRILRESLRPGLLRERRTESWPATAYDRPPDSTRPPALARAPRWGAVAVASAAALLSVALIAWMLRLGSLSESHHRDSAGQPAIFSPASGASPPVEGGPARQRRQETHFASPVPTSLSEMERPAPAPESRSVAGAHESAEPLVSRPEPEYRPPVAMPRALDPSPFARTEAGEPTPHEATERAEDEPAKDTVGPSRRPAGESSPAVEPAN